MSDGDEPTRVLLIDDEGAMRAILRRVLHRAAIEVHEAEDGDAGLDRARTVQPDLILLDVQLPGRDGFETLRRLKEDARTRSIPVIFVSGRDAPSEKARGLDLGAVDYIVKPVDAEEFPARVRVALRARGERIRLERRAYCDALTGLGNRLALEEHLAADWSLARRRGAPLGVLMTDFDRFKSVNDLGGHAAGDSLLAKAAGVLRETVRAGDFVARYGGDEFLVIAQDCDLEGILTMGERLRRAIAEIRLDDPPDFPVRMSVGAAVREERDADPSALIRRADVALYHAKGSGRNAAWACYRGEMLPADQFARGAGMLRGATASATSRDPHDHLPRQRPGAAEGVLLQEPLGPGRVV